MITERYQDALLNIEKALTLLSSYQEMDSTAEGRMISQLKWLRGEALANRLPIPVDPAWTSTLRYVYTDHALDHIKGIRKYLRVLMIILVDGGLLTKPRHYLSVARKIDHLLSILEPVQEVPAPKDSLVQELKSLRAGLLNSTLEVPVEREDYPVLNTVYTEEVLISIPGAQNKLEEIWNLLVEGVRPSTWA
jgi:hypothetical protein